MENHADNNYGRRVGGRVSGHLMKSKYLAALLFLAVTAISSISSAGTCPTRMDRLDDFAACMVPLKGTIGTAAVYSSGQYDEDHRALMQAMASQAVVPPTVIPMAPYPLVPYSPYYSAASFYFRLGSNPYFWAAYH